MAIPTMKTVIKNTCNDEFEAKLFRAVIRQFGDWKQFFEYVEDYRDASAGISGFIYHSETEKFAKRQLLNITVALRTFEEEIGGPLTIKDDGNRLNWLAWFAVEYIAYKVETYKDTMGN